MPIDRSRLPVPGPPVSYAFPEVRRRTFDNGVRVSTIEHHEVPLLTCFVLMPVGSSQDPDVQPGLAAITGDMLDEGSGDLDAMQIHEALGRIGAHLDTEIGADATLLELTTLQQHAPRALDLLASMVHAPRLDQHDLDRVRELRLNRLIQLRDMPPALADRVFTQLLYPGHPYGHLPIGTEEALRALTLDDVTSFHRRAYVPSLATIIAVGDASHDELLDLVAGAFAGWTASDQVQPGLLDIAAIEIQPVGGGRVATVHRPGAAQSELRIGHVGLPRTTPDYHALLVLNMILGGQFVSRINMNLREDKGYTYGARTSFEFRRAPGPFIFQTSVQSDVTADAIREVMGELQAIRTDRPVTAQELELGRAALTRGYPRNFETAEQLGRAAVQLALYDLPDDYFTTFVDRVLAVDVAEVTRVAQAHIDPQRLLTVVVGDREKVGPTLDSLNLGELSEVGVA
ncbi:MAG: M16 family metallopeptidase [Vicinamibacterales bacterium]